MPKAYCRMSEIFRHGFSSKYTITWALLESMVTNSQLDCSFYMWNPIQQRMVPVAWSLRMQLSVAARATRGSEVLRMPEKNGSSCLQMGQPFLPGRKGISGHEPESHFPWDCLTKKAQISKHTARLGASLQREGAGAVGVQGHSHGARAR